MRPSRGRLVVMEEVHTCCVYDAESVSSLLLERIAPWDVGRDTFRIRCRSSLVCPQLPVCRREDLRGWVCSRRIVVGPCLLSSFGWLWQQTIHRCSYPMLGTSVFGCEAINKYKKGPNKRSPACGPPIDIQLALGCQGLALLAMQLRAPRSLCRTWIARLLRRRHLFLAPSFHAVYANLRKPHRRFSSLAKQLDRPRCQAESSPFAVPFFEDVSSKSPRQGTGINKQRAHDCGAPHTMDQNLIPQGELGSAEQHPLG